MGWSVQRSILVPFDFSDHSVAAVESALELAEDASSVHVLHVLPHLTATEPGVVWGTIDDSSRIEHTLKALEDALPTSKYGQLCKEVRLGDPGSVASKRAEDLNAELIVVGSHGRTGLSRFVIGSVAERVARMSHCPVLIIKIPGSKG